jgi:hypothetical protein
MRSIITLMAATLYYSSTALLFAAPANEPAHKLSTSTRTFVIPKHGDLNLNVPADWNYSVRYPRPGLPPTIEFTVGPAKKFSAQITALFPREKDQEYNSPAKVRQIADASLKRMLPTAREAAVELEEVKGKEATGYCYTLTDKAPNPGSFECMTTAFVGVGDLLLTVTLLHHQKDSPERSAALEALKSASQSPTADGPTVLRVRFPTEKPVTLLLPAAGFDFAGERFDAARKSHEMMAVKKQDGLVMSIFTEPAPKPGDATIVRETYWGRAQKSPLKKEDIKLDKSKEFATVQYLVTDVGGDAVKQKHMNLYAAKEGAWADVHLSKTGFAEKDQALFDRIISGIQFEGDNAKP